MKQLSLGFGRCDFTPDVPVSMNSSRTGTEIGDRLYATCLAWQDENGIVLQYSLDLRNIYAPLYEMISKTVAEKTGIPRPQTRRSDGQSVRCKALESENRRRSGFNG